MKAHDAAVLAVSTDPPERSREVSDAYALEFPLLSDPDLQVIEAYGVRHPGGDPRRDGDIARPAVFLIDREGNVVWRDLTDNWRVRVRPATLRQRLADLP